MISAVFSLFSGGFKGGSVYVSVRPNTRGATESHEQDVVVFGFCPEVLEDALFPEPLHVIPILNLSMSDRVVQ